MTEKAGKRFARGGVTELVSGTARSRGARARAGAALGGVAAAVGIVLDQWMPYMAALAIVLVLACIVAALHGLVLRRQSRRGAPPSR